MPKSIKFFSLLYLLPQLSFFYARGMESFFSNIVFLISWILYTLILIAACRQRINLKQDSSLYLVPFKVIFLSFLFLLVITIVCSLAIGWISGGIKGALNESLGQIPNIMVGLLVTLFSSIIPIIISLVYIKVVLNREGNNMTGDGLDT